MSQTLLNRLVVAAVAFGFLVVLAVAGLAAAMMQRNIEYTDWVTHTYEVQRAIGDFRVLNERIETARRGYLLSRAPLFYTGYRTSADALPGAVERIRKLTVDSPEQQNNVKQLSRLQVEQLAALEFSIAAAREGRVQTGDFNDDQGVLRTRAIRALLEKMDRDEGAKLAVRTAARDASQRQLFVAMAVAGALLALVAIASILVIINYTRDLAKSRDELRILNEGLEDVVQTRTADLQRANDEIQRFAYIVSHDLRSPLVNVMGFTSELEASIKPLDAFLDRVEADAPTLTSPDAKAAVREDLPEAIRFIRTSTQKMDRLINAILKLSREGRRVLTPERIDMTRMFEGIAATLKHRSDELGATIEVAPDLPDIITDRLAAEQVFANLVENALKYLAPARPGHITISAHRRPGDRVIFDVKDNGRGIDPKDHERVFELFRRSGTQDQPGEGIGLAHVRALAYRLGGTVSVESTLDQGATFRVSLPARLSSEGAAA